MNQQPSETLTERAADKIEAAFPANTTDQTRVVWWDDGGYLREAVESAAEDLGIGFRAAETFPLDLREGAVNEEQSSDRPMLWYVGEAKNGRDWFRDIRETGGEITCSIEELTAELYEVNPWDIFDTERDDAAARQEAAEIIIARFAPHSIPQYDDLKEEIITKGQGQLLDHLLRDGWPEISRDTGTVNNVRARLRENHDIPVPEAAGPEEITNTVRRWAVAQSLMYSGVGTDQFPNSVQSAGYSPLKDLLQIGGARASAERYLGEAFWPELIDRLDDVWLHADCPVDGALDIALWTAWHESFVEDNLETCIERAEKRQSALSVYPSDTAWLTLWTQAEHLARLKQDFAAWDSRSGSRDPFELYADPDDGTWRIDDRVLQLQLTGAPETGLPSSHPAAEQLPDIREELVTTRYRDYLDTLAEAVEAQLQVGNPLVDKDPAYEWWSDHEKEFDELGTVAILLIDALRFDLAQRLADRLDEEFEVKRETRLATLPTETKFGMAALTPGRSFRFSVGMDGDQLTASQGDRSLANKQQRTNFYDDEGWEVPSGPEDGWEHQRIAYYDKEIDDVGEGEIGDIGRHFSDYIEDLSGMIHRKLDDQNWDRIYVVTDHGFVLLPEGTTMEAVSADSTDAELKYRRVAGDNIDEAGTGVYLPQTTPGLEYLNTNLRMLVNPRHHFSKRGYSTNQYYHGGLLPQECMLSFLEIQK